MALEKSELENGAADTGNALKTGDFRSSCICSVSCPASASHWAISARAAVICVSILRCCTCHALISDKRSRLGCWARNALMSASSCPRLFCRSFDSFSVLSRTAVPLFNRSVSSAMVCSSFLIPTKRPSSSAFFLCSVRFSYPALCS